MSNNDKSRQAALRARQRSMSRRGFLAAAGVLACAGSGPVSVLAAASLNLDLDDPWDRLTALAKLRGDIAGNMVMWWMQGVRYGVVNAELTPLYGMLVGSMGRLRPVPGQGYEMTMLELSYLTDLETGAVLDEFRNPYNGNLCKVPEQRLGPYPVMLTPTGVVLPDIPLFGDVDLRTQVGPAVVEGDEVWLRDDSSVRVDSDHPMLGEHTYNELVTYRGRLSDLNDPAVTSAPAEIIFQSVTSWREWLRADGVGGHTTARAAGRKIYRIEDFPEAYLRHARARHPEIIGDPERALATPPPPPGGH